MAARGFGKHRRCTQSRSASGPTVAVTGLATAAVLLGAAGWALPPAWRERFKPADRAREAAARRIEDADRQLSIGLPDATSEAVRLLREAVAEAPQHAPAWGRLAIAWRDAGTHGPAAEAAQAVAASDQAARRALALDPAQPDALAASALLMPFYGDWAAPKRSYAACSPQHRSSATRLPAGRS